MKKIIIAILIVIIAVGVGFGIYALVKPNGSIQKEENKLTHRVDLMEDEYTVGEKVVFRVIATADVAFTHITYSVNNGDEVKVSVTAGESAEFEEAIGKGKYYVDSGATIIETSSMTAGYYTLVFYAYDADETKYIITSDPIVFRLTTASAGE